MNHVQIQIHSKEFHSFKLNFEACYVMNADDLHSLI